MYCKNCGEKISSDAKFCIYCGTKVEEIAIEKDIDLNEIVENEIDIFEQDEIEEKAEFRDLEEMEELPKEIEETFMVEDIEKEDEQNEEEKDNEEKEHIVTNGFTKEDVENMSSKELQNLQDKQNEEKVAEGKEVKSEPVFHEELISIVLGGCSVLLSLFVSVFALPMSISGLVFGAYGKIKNKKKFSAGKLLSWLGIITSLVTLTVYTCCFLTVLNSVNDMYFDYNLAPYQYNVSNNYNEIEDKQAEKDFQKAQEMLNKQEEAKKEVVEKKEEPVEVKETVKEDREPSKYTNVGYMEYTIPAVWKFNGIREAGGNSVANVFSRDEDTAFLAIKAMDLSSMVFSKEALLEEVTQMYGGIANQGSFTTSNGIVWDFITTPVYEGEGRNYVNHIYYHATNDGSALLYFEIYVPDTSEESVLLDDIDNILNSVRKFRD